MGYTYRVNNKFLRFYTRDKHYHIVLENNSEFAICHVVRYGNVNSIPFKIPLLWLLSNNETLLYSPATNVAVLYNA